MFFNKILGKSSDPISRSSAIEDLQGEMRREANAIVQFWIDTLHDELHGGYYGMMTNDLSVDRKADKGFVQQARALWGLSMSARYSGISRLTEAAHEQYEFIINHYLDDEYGGFQWLISFDGTLLDDHKHLYAQDLGIYALAEYFTLSGNQKSIDIAIDLFNYHEQYYQGARPYSYIPNRNRNWSPTEELRYAQGQENCPVHPGILLHTMEAYTRLYRETHKSEIRHDLNQVHKFIVNHCFDQESGLMWLYMKDDLEPASKELRPGHDVEFAWLCLEAIDLLDNQETIISEALRSIHAVQGLCDRNTGAYRTIRIGQHKTRMVYRWWDQAELMVALWYAFHLTNKDKYLTHLFKLWKFVKRSFRNKKVTEWNWLVKERNIGYTGYLAGPNKSLYHHVRALHQIGYSLHEEPLGKINHIAPIKNEIQ